MATYNKFAKIASSIVLWGAGFTLVGCDSLGLPNYLHHDEVPPEVRDLPRPVGQPSVDVKEAEWPRLGDVPGRPKDFSPQVVSQHYMDELDYERNEAAAMQRAATPDDPTGKLVPPQLPKP